MDDEAEMEASTVEVGLLSVWLLLTILVGEDEAREKGSDSYERSLEELKCIEFKIDTLTQWRIQKPYKIFTRKYIISMYSEINTIIVSI